MERVSYCHEFRRLGAIFVVIEHAKRLLFGEQLTQKMEQVPTIVCEPRLHVAKIQIKDDTGGVSLFLNGSGEGFKVHVSFGQRKYLAVREHIGESIERVDEDLGSDAGFLLTVDNVKQHHNGLEKYSVMVLLSTFIYRAVYSIGVKRLTLYVWIPPRMTELNFLIHSTVLEKPLMH